jgi:hypothetical protein
MALLTSGCASPTPFEIRAFHFETNRANYPREIFTGPLPPIVTKQGLPADPWTEAFKVISQAISDIVKHVMHAEEYKSSAAIRFGYFTWDMVLIRWGPYREVKQARAMWREHERFLSHWPPVINMPKPEDIREASQRFVGLYDVHPPEPARGPVIREMKAATPGTEIE